MLTLIFLQTLGAAPGFDLKTLPTKSPGSGDIVVTARREPTRRIAADAGPPPPEGMPRAEARLFGAVRGSVHGEQAGVGGFVSNRAMVSIKVPF